MGIVTLRSYSLLRFLSLILGFSVIVQGNDSLNATEEDPAAFPKECTWQCYLRQNHDLYQLLPWERDVAINHYIENGRFEARSCACKVILLAGPHKCSSSSMQSLAMLFSKLTTDTQWSWIGKHIKTFSFFIQSFMDVNKVQEFWIRDAWEIYGDTLTALYYLQNNVDMKELSSTELAKNENKIKEEMLNFESLKLMNMNQIMLSYQQGYNVIFGSEEIDVSTMSQKYFASTHDDILQEIVSILPKETVQFLDKNFVAVVVYRAPRFDHLKSMYGEMYLKETDDLTKSPSFKEFMCNRNMMELQFHTLDALALASKLLQKGMKVQLFDMSALSKDYHEDLELVRVMGCDVMNLNCTYDESSEQILPFSLSQYPHKDELLELLKKKENTRDYSHAKHLLDVTEDEKLQIETVINFYDCIQFSTMLEYSDNLEILYLHKLQKNMLKCSDSGDYATPEKVVKAITNILGCASSDDETVEGEE